MVISFHERETLSHLTFHWILNKTNISEKMCKYKYNVCMCSCTFNLNFMSFFIYIYIK